jgi:hypothetical protein
MTLPVTQDLGAALHQLLLRGAGRLPDQLVSEARQWLADGDMVAVGQAVTYAALSGRVPMTAGDAELLTRILTDAGEDVEALNGLEVSDQELDVAYGFAPVGPDALGGDEDAVPYSLDLTLPYDGPGGLDDLDQAASGVVAAMPADALWRGWRLPARDTKWPAPRRVFLVHVDPGADPVAVAAAVQTALIAAGESDPQVEAFTDAAALPTYQRTAIAFGALVWSRRPAVEFQLARLFDSMGPDGTPQFAADHPLLDVGESERVLGYLEEHTALVLSPDYAIDVVDPERGAVVPVAFRTDGVWIWAEGCGYYLSEYGLAPDAGLLAHIRAMNYEHAEVDDVALHRALSRLYAGAPA